MIVMKGSWKNGLYMLHGETVIGLAAAATITELQRAKLWHLRLGHMSERGMLELQKQGLLGNVEVSKLDFCETCTWKGY